MSRIAEKITSLNGDVIKYIHTDRSETTVKLGHSCSAMATSHGLESPLPGNDDKMTVFVSSSVGCSMNCKMCYLTTKGFPYERLSSDQITANVVDVIDDFMLDNPLRPIRLSMMGMGEALLVDGIKNACYDIEDKIEAESGTILGLDVGTCIPSGSFNRIADSFPCMFDGPQRLFFSLHSPVDGVRKAMMPGVADLDKSFESLRAIRHDFDHDFNVVFHYTLIDGVNDSALDALQLASLLANEQFGREQIRILRYNRCENAPYEESKRFESFVTELAGYRDNVRYQVSSGSEIKAACGQFVARKTLSAT